MLQAFLILFVTVLLLRAFWGSSRRKLFPPGPPLYPILGNLPQILNDHPFRAYHKLAQKYGELMYVKLGTQDQVVVSSYKAMKDLLDKEEMSGRFWNGFLVDRSRGKELGMIFSSLPAQKELKAWVIRTMRDYGFNKSESMESVIRTELGHFHELLSSISKKSGGRHRVEKFFQPSLMSILWVLMAGRRYSYNDPNLRKLLQVNSTWFQTGNFGGGIVLAFPFLRLMFKNWTGYYKMKQVNDEIWGFIEEIFAEHRSRKEYKSGPNSFVDHFLHEIDKAGGKSDLFTDEQFVIICYDLFQVGAETTSNTLAFAMLYMILHPHIQKKVHDELCQVYEKRQIGTITDKAKVPYTTATMMEIIRLSNILPVPGPRKVTKDYHYNGHLIPEGAFLAFNTYSVMRDTKIFGDDVDVFRPERFLGEDGKLNGRVEYIQMAWGAGRRSCIGDKLAQTTIFMYLTYMFRNFSFSKVPDQEDPTTEPILLSRLMLSPQPYEMVVTAL